MNRFRIMLGIVVIIVLGAARSLSTTPVALKVPEQWPPITYDLAANPLTEEGIALGRKLFYDPILSADSVVSCSSCHLSYTAFTHVDHAVSHGIRDSIGTRNSMALMNLAWSKSFMWDGAVNHLDMQALAPISHPAEMGEDLVHVIARMQRGQLYPKLFHSAFQDSIITGERVLKAIAQFELTLISSNAKYDRVMAKEEVFTEQEAQGYALFKENCDQCHKEPLFTTGAFANIGLPIDPVYNDPGRMSITGDPMDSLHFKIPTLRNVEFSFPYMHDGRFRTLREVLQHYAEAIVPSTTLAPELVQGIDLTEHQRVDLVAFLLTLSDKGFCFNPDHAFPRDR